GSGGIHLLYRVPGDYYIKTTGPTSNPLARGVDTRGDGGQIIVAPSRNLQGPYQWLPGYAPWDRQPSAASSALLELLLEHRILMIRDERLAGVPGTHPAGCPPASRPAAHLLLDKYLQQAAPGNRNASGFHLALQLRDNGYSLAE